MKHLEEYFTSWDGKELYLNSYIPDGDVKGIIIAVHGFGEYGSRYETLASKFCEKEYAFIIYDQRGHGLTEGDKGVIDGAILTKDLEFVLSKVKKIYTSEPLILYGHSMGGNIALRYLCDIKDKTDIKLSIISSPWLKVHKNPPLPLISLLRTILGKNFTFKTKLNELSHDDKYLKEIGYKKLGHKVISFGLAEQIMKNGLYVLDHPSDIMVPTLLMSAGEDKVVDTKTIKRLADFNNHNITYINWEGFYHELHNEKQRDLVFNEMIKYIEIYLKNN